MRDAFGGAFMIKIFLVFIFVYICFTAIALNYAKAFKVKNSVIEYLESNEIADLGTNSFDANRLQEMDEFFNKEILGHLNYKIENVCDRIVNSSDVYCHPVGVVIRRSGKAVNTEGVHYTVSTYVGWDTGFLKSLSSLNGNNKEVDSVSGYWKISGETRLIVNE